MTDEETAELCERRMGSLLGAWYFISEDANLVDATDCRLMRAAANEAIQQYVADVAALKQRYGIPHRIDRPKIAGLMAAAIMRYRPIAFLGDKYSDVSHAHVNEILAIVHGLIICLEKLDTAPENDDLMRELWKQPWLQDWMNRLVYHLHCRNFTPEGLVMVFHTAALLFAQVLPELPSLDSHGD